MDVIFYSYIFGDWLLFSFPLCFFLIYFIFKKRKKKRASCGHVLQISILLLTLDTLHLVLVQLYDAVLKLLRCPCQIKYMWTLIQELVMMMISVKKEKLQVVYFAQCLGAWRKHHISRAAAASLICQYWRSIRIDTAVRIGYQYFGKAQTNTLSLKLHTYVKEQTHEGRKWNACQYVACFDNCTECIYIYYYVTKETTKLCNSLKKILI